MKKELIITLLALLAAVIHNILFWKSNWGINTFLFSSILVGLLAFAKPDCLRFRYTRLLAIGVLISSLMVTLHNHTISKSVYSFSVFLLIGFAQTREIRFLYYGFLLSLSGFFGVPANFIRKFRTWKGFGGNGRQLLYWFKIAIVPILITCIFFVVYANASPKFAQFTAIFSDWLDDFIVRLFDWNLGRFFFFLFGLGLIWAVLWSSKFQDKFHDAESLLHFPMSRIREGLRNPFHSTLALQSEYRMGLVSLVLLNILLFLVNGIDMRFVWLDYGNFSAPELKQFVHTGTSMLILAILMAMGVLLYFFRKNLNFFPNNSLLKQLSYAWIIQNAVLALSVGIRNFHYVQHYGLTYKRIGVFVFIGLVFYGLWTFFMKINTRKTAYYLLFKNSWAVYFALLAMTVFNWDTLITKYNIRANTVHGIGVSYLVHDLSYGNTGLLEKYSDKLTEYNASAEVSIKRKRERLESRLHKMDWRSWNWAEARLGNNGE